VCVHTRGRPHAHAHTHTQHTHCSSTPLTHTLSLTHTACFCRRYTARVCVCPLALCVCCTGARPTNTAMVCDYRLPGEVMRPCANSFRVVLAPYYRRMPRALGRCGPTLFIMQEATKGVPAAQADTHVHSLPQPHTPTAHTHTTINPHLTLPHHLLATHTTHSLPAAGGRAGPPPHTTSCYETTLQWRSAHTKSASHYM
jgi:hypothetical protein